jgi:hypothetical protein
VNNTWLTSKGRNSIPTACPLCHHSPLEPDDCNQNKSLRLTVRAFLKGQEKKRAEKANASAAQTPQEVESPAPTASAQSPASENHTNGAPDQQPAASDQSTAGPQDGGEETAPKPDSPDVRFSGAIAEIHAKKYQANGDKNDQEAMEVDEVPATEVPKDKEINGEGDGKQDKPNEDVGRANGNQTPAGGWGMNGQMFPYGYGANQNGFAGMGWSQPGVFNPMMQMQMQNNMANGAWGYQNMMGSFAPHVLKLGSNRAQEWA